MIKSEILVTMGILAGRSVLTNEKRPKTNRKWSRPVKQMWEPLVQRTSWSWGSFSSTVHSATHGQLISCRLQTLLAIMSSLNNLAEQSQNSTCFRQNWREKGVTFPAEGTNFVLVNQRGRRVLSCKPAIPGRLAAPVGTPLFNNWKPRSGLKTSCSVEFLVVYRVKHS